MSPTLKLFHKTHGWIPFLPPNWTTNTEPTAPKTASCSFCLSSLLVVVITIPSGRFYKSFQEKFPSLQARNPGFAFHFCFSFILPHPTSYPTDTLPHNPVMLLPLPVGSASLRTRKTIITAPDLGCFGQSLSSEIIYYVDTFSKSTDLTPSVCHEKVTHCL